MYSGAVTSVRTTCLETGEFSVTISLHQESTLSPFRSALIVDELTARIQEEAPWCMLCADNMLSVG